MIRKVHKVDPLCCPACDLVQNKARFIKFISTVSLEFVVKIIADSN